MEHNFSTNKIILNLWLRWHILKSYRFAGEVTYKVCQRCSVLVIQYKRLFQWVWSEYFINEIARKKVSGGRYSCTSYIYLKVFITEIKVEINEKLKMVSLYESHLCKQPYVLSLIQIQSGDSFAWFVFQAELQQQN